VNPPVTMTPRTMTHQTLSPGMVTPQARPQMKIPGLPMGPIRNKLGINESLESFLRKKYAGNS
jgi:hypothetical protein